MAKSQTKAKTMMPSVAVKTAAAASAADDAKFAMDAGGRRLKLARIAPELIEQFRAGEMTLECVMAFTLTDDHDRQMNVWNAVKDSYHIHPQSIKRHLTETAHSASSSIGRFVGIDAYEAAGGVSCCATFLMTMRQRIWRILSYWNASPSKSCKMWPRAMKLIGNGSKYTCPSTTALSAVLGASIRKTSNLMLTYWPKRML